jgi:hypothetical protein
LDGLTDELAADTAFTDKVHVGEAFVPVLVY